MSDRVTSWVRSRIVFTALGSTVVSLAASAEIHRVPEQFPTVQVAVEAAGIGDTVLINPGEYNESVVLPDRDVTIAGNYLLSGDSLDVASTILRPVSQSGERCLRADQVDGDVDTLRIIGLSFKGSLPISEIRGGGLEVAGRYFYLQHCNVDSCYSFFGGGFRAEDSHVSVLNSLFMRTGSHEAGVVAYLNNCVTELDSIVALAGFSTGLEPEESAFFVNGGSFSLRSSVISQFGWSDIPGAHGLEQVGVPDYIEIVDCEIRENRFHRFFRLPGEGLRQPSTIRFDSNLVADNEFQHDLFSTDESDTGSVSRFRFNTFTSNGRLSEGNWISRMLFTLSGTTQVVDISHNLFTDNEAQENSVALISSPTDSSVTRFHHNYILDNFAEGFANPPGGVIMVISVNPGVIFHNIIAESHGYAAFQGLWSFPESHAPFNYWGDSTGPRQSLENPEGQGDSVEHLVSITPWAVDSTFDSENVVIHSSQPLDFALGFPYPNPFNSSVTIEYALTREQDATVIIYDLLGREVERFLNDRQSIGVHQAVWNANHFASGIYFAQLSSPDSRQLPMTQKLLLLK